MKWTLALGALFLSLSVHAADKKIGNMIAVEREMTDIYENCVGQLKDKPAEENFYSCSFSLAKNNTEFSTTKMRVFGTSSVQKSCSVEGYAEAGQLIITFYSNVDKAGIAEAKNCLKRALNDLSTPNTLSFVIFKIED
jgi:hypothetical protein